MRGSKRQTWEGGIRVAFVIAWKGHLDAGRVDRRPIIQLDVLPTALAAAERRAAPRLAPATGWDDGHSQRRVDLADDIGETRDRGAERPEKVKELADLWQAWNRQLSKPT